MKTFISVLIFLILVIQCNSDRVEKLNLDYQPQTLEIFAPGTISSNLYERDMAISPDGTEIIYTLSDYWQSRRCLVMIKKNDTEWGEKQLLAFSGLYNDLEPFFSPDGKKLYFASDRPVKGDTSRRDYNIWVSERMKNGWGEPVSLDSVINSKKDEYYPSLSQNYNLYFTSAREGGIGKEDIYLSRYVNGNYTEPVPLDTNVNSKTYEFNAYVSPTENLIIFSSYGRKDDMGGGDLYYSKKDQQGSWTPSVSMGSLINSNKLDYCPFIDLPRGNFYFTSEKMIKHNTRFENVSDIELLANDILNGMGNIYRISTDNLSIKP